MKNKTEISNAIQSRFPGSSKERHIELVNHVELLYESTKDYLDSNFEKRFIHEIESRYTEMYFIQALLNSGLKLVHSSNKGLDVKINNISGWAEFVACTNGKEGSENSLTPYQMGVVYIRENDKILLRISAAISEKFNKIAADIEKKFVKSSEPIILFVSCGWLYENLPLFLEGGVPDWFGCLLPISDPKLMINKGTSATLSYEFDPYITKLKDGKEIDHNIQLFFGEKSKNISTIVFSYLNVLHTTPLSEIGNDFIIIHNPRARNPINTRLLRSELEYIVECSSDMIRIEKMA